MPRIRRVVIEGYASISAADVEIGDVTVLVGANGAGKSNFISALDLLGRIVDERLSYEVGLRGGASALLHVGEDHSEQIRLRIDADADSSEFANAYEAVLVLAANDQLIFARETTSLHSVSHHPTPHGDSLVSAGRSESRLSETSTPVSRYVRDILRGCRVYHFQDTSRDAPVKKTGYVSDNDYLKSDASNLAAFLLRMRRTDSKVYRRIVTAVKLNAPFFRDFHLVEEESGRIRLRWTQTNTDVIFPVEALSDGTLRYICLATLLLQPVPPALIALDEPELGLHPFAIHQLAELVRSAAVRSQIILATQSVTLLNQFSLEDLVVVNRVKGDSVFERPDGERLRAWLDDYSLGELWEKNVLGGRPRIEAVGER
jgi:predicted ATPase